MDINKLIEKLEELRDMNINTVFISLEGNVYEFTVVGQEPVILEVGNCLTG